MRSATATPSSSALCASMGPRTASPTAHTPGRLVLQSPSTTIAPRSSSFRPTASAFSPVVLGVRPIDTISLSTSSVCAWPLASVYATLTLLDLAFLETLIAPTCTPSAILRPCLSNARLASLAICSSAAPRNVGRPSKMVTSVPSRRHTDPISRPITPAPITPSFFGVSAMRSAPALDRMVSSSNGTPGRARGLEPVAMMTWGANRVCGAGPPTPMSYPPSLAAAKAPVPWKNCTLFFLSR